MYNFRTNPTKLEDLLNRMGQNLQLDDSRREKMETAYKAVTKWIEDDEQFFRKLDFEIYPHGSVRIGTSVKPIEREEFDLDFVVHISLDWNQHNPMTVYNELKRRIEENDTYKKMLIPKSRVLRLDYAGDFHMDIMPGCQEIPDDNDKIRVPDKKRHNWVSSNPRGYGDWFEGRSKMVRDFVLEKALAMEQLPAQQSYSLKKPLVRAVQIIKRFRDLYFQNDMDNAVSSIILTTLAGQYYEGDGTIYGTVDNIVSKMQVAAMQNVYNFSVTNPVNPEEDFTDKWKEDPHLYRCFAGFVQELKKTWESIKQDESIDYNGKQLQKMSGLGLYNRSIADQQRFYTLGLMSPFTGNSDDKYNGLRKMAEKSKPYSH